MYLTLTRGLCIAFWAGSAQVCLLCCQPEPVSRSFSTRVPQLQPWDPSALPAWLGSAISMLHRTWSAPVHCITLPPRGYRRLDTPSNQPWLWFAKGHVPLQTRLAPCAAKPPLRVGTKNQLHFSICACHPCAGAMLIFSVSFQF